MADKYNPEVGEIWWFGPHKKHYLFYAKENPSEEYKSYTFKYKVYCIETGAKEYIFHGNMNAHGEGWFKKIQ